MEYSPLLAEDGLEAMTQTLVTGGIATSPLDLESVIVIRTCIR